MLLGALSPREHLSPIKKICKVNVYTSLYPAYVVLVQLLIHKVNGSLYHFSFNQNLIQ